jgi:hypothetical protein
MIIRDIRLFILILAPIFIGGASCVANSASFNVGMVINAAEETTTSSARYTCSAAKMKISLAGYQDIETLDCKGRTYLFSAQQDSTFFNIGFDSITGMISIV